MPKAIVRPIPEKANGQFDPASPDTMDELKKRGSLRFSPSPKVNDLLYPSRYQQHNGRSA